MRDVPRAMRKCRLDSWGTWDIWVMSCSRKVENFILYFFNHVSLPHQYTNAIQRSRNTLNDIQPQWGDVGLVYYTMELG